ncbi:hypothetical protein [Nannocystis pusilla]|uniref:hypothetical protein n=1 Tax=Nannocystis pusilla TaxID=889268 RepID=UPI003B7D5D0F
MLGLQLPRRVRPRRDRARAADRDPGCPRGRRRRRRRPLRLPPRRRRRHLLGRFPLRDGHDTAAAELPALAGAVRLAAGADHLCAVGRDDRVLCIGTGSEGQLGDGQPPDLEPARGLTGSPRPGRASPRCSTSTTR